MMRRSLWALGLLATVATLLPAPVHAAAPTAVPVLADVCADGYLYGDTVAATPSGRGLQGFASFRFSATCGDQIFYFTGSGTTWTATATGLSGSVVGAAADGTGTYLLYLRGRADGRRDFRIAKRSADGTVSELAVLGSTAALGEVEGAIVARRGGWFAVWPEWNAEKNQHELYKAGTLFGATITRRRVAGYVVGDGTAALALGPDGVSLAWSRTNDERRSVYLSSTANGRSWSTRTLAKDFTPSGASSRLDVATGGGRTVASWTERTEVGDRVIVADNLTDDFVRHEPPALNDWGSWDARVATNGSVVLAGYATGDEHPGSGYLAVRSGDSWGVFDPNSGIPSSIDSYGVAAVSIDGSTATSLVFSGGQLFAVAGTPLPAR